MQTVTEVKFKADMGKQVQDLLGFCQKDPQKVRDLMNLMYCLTITPANYFLMNPEARTAPVVPVKMAIPAPIPALPPANMKERGVNEMNELMTIKGVRGHINESGTAELNLEDVARGLGFTQVKSGVEYIRWETVTGYLSSYGVSQQVGKDTFIPENIFYKLCFKASNETARRFQDLVTDEVLPAIRKHGGYLTPAKVEELLLNPDAMITMLTALKDERSKNTLLTVENEKQKQLIGELKPAKDYVDRILSGKGAMTTTQIAADYGISANKLNKILKGEHIQRYVGDQWVLYKEHMGKGWTKSETIPIVRADGTPDTKLFTKWTQKGRLMINEVLNRRGIYANVDLIQAIA